MAQKDRALEIFWSATKYASKKGQHTEQAFELFSKAFDLGEARAAYALSTWYFHGYYVRKSTRRAFQLMKIASEADIPDAHFFVGQAYLNGWGVSKNMKRSFRSFVAAALLGHIDASTEVAYCYYYGHGVDKDRELARIWRRFSDKERQRASKAPVRKRKVMDPYLFRFSDYR